MYFLVSLIRDLHHISPRASTAYYGVRSLGPRKRHNCLDAASSFTRTLKKEVITEAELSPNRRSRIKLPRTLYRAHEALEWPFSQGPDVDKGYAYIHR